MIALIIPNLELHKFPIPCSNGGYWNPTNNTVSNVYWLQLEAQSELDKHKIKYTIKEVEIKKDTYS